VILSVISSHVTTSKEQHHDIHISPRSLEIAMNATEQQAFDKMREALEEISDHAPWGGSKDKYIHWMRNTAREALSAAKAVNHIPDTGEMAQPNWYCIDKSGMATLCADRDDALQNAKLAAIDLPNNAPYRAVQLRECDHSEQPQLKEQKT
jgi:hypothetical protein